jgi:hypothetical protein
MVDNLQQAGFPPAMIYAYQKTGLLVLDNRPLTSDKDLAEWDAAIEEYKAMHPEGEGGQRELF